MHRTGPGAQASADRIERERTAAQSGIALATQYATIEARLAARDYLCGDFSAAVIAEVLAADAKLSAPVAGAFKDAP